MKKTFTVIVLIIALLVGGFYAFNAYIYNEKQADSGEVSRYRGTLTGETVCLPHRDTGGPHTMECAFGMKTDVGEYYALDFTLMSQQHLPMDIGVRFTANGQIIPLEFLSTDQWQKYDIEGIFSVTDLTQEM